MFQTLTLSPSNSNFLLQFHSPSPSRPRHCSSVFFPARSARPANLRGRAAVQDLPETAAALEGGIAPPVTLYEVLKVKRDASAGEIKAAFRTLAKLHHPDASDGSDGSDFIQIHHAYETLSDPSSRAIYDLTLRLGGRVGTAPSMSFGRDFVIKRRRSGFYPTRRWETDQCW